MMDGRRAEPAGQCDQGEDDRTEAAAAALDMHAGSLIVCIVPVLIISWGEQSVTLLILVART
jgi:hypothetical protein